MRYALLGSILLGVSCGLLGSFIVVRTMALFGDALSHAQKRKLRQSCLNIATILAVDMRYSLGKAGMSTSFGPPCKLLPFFRRALTREPVCRQTSYVKRILFFAVSAMVARWIGGQ